MPKTPINEDGDASSREGQVRPGPQASGGNEVVLSEPVASQVESGSQPELWLRIDSAIGPSCLGSELARREWVGGTDAASEADGSLGRCHFTMMSEPAFHLNLAAHAARLGSMPRPIAHLFDLTWLGSRPMNYSAAEFFAGIGLVRLALERAGIKVTWANDIEPVKSAVYGANFSLADYVLDDIRNVSGEDVPAVDLATASFPCTDLSLAGNRLGLEGHQSGMFWEFARVIAEMHERAPKVILLENVPGFATSHAGQDIRNVILRLNGLGYECDVFQVDAALFIPQSRPRMFIVGSRSEADVSRVAHDNDWARPRNVDRVYADNDDLSLRRADLCLPVAKSQSLADIVERLRSEDNRWWSQDRVGKFLDSLFPNHERRVRDLIEGDETVWRTAYRRTRAGVATWEVRADAIAGCLRTARGGSSKQAVVEAGRGNLRIRWMTAREYAALQGAPSLDLSAVTETQAMFGLGDAVCVPVVEWIARTYLRPLLEDQPISSVRRLSAA